MWNFQMIFIIFLTNWFVLASVILSYKTNDFFIKKINLAFRCVTLIFSRKLATHTLSKKKNRWKLSFLIPATFPHMPWTRKNSLLTKRVLKALRIGSTSSASLASKQMQYQWQRNSFVIVATIFEYFVVSMHLLTQWVPTKYKPSRRLRSHFSINNGRN